MPRPILGATIQSHTGAQFGAVTPGKAVLTGPKLQQRLRRSRSGSYIEAMTRLDAGSHHADRAGLDALIQAIANEFPELTIEQRPLGIVSKCHLGAPYHVHICDLGGGIVEHFERNRSMPPQFERARALAVHPSYAFIEIYPDCVRAVGFDGAVSVIDTL
jgi:hypothetical protein